MSCEHKRKFYVNIQTNGRVETDCVFCADCEKTIYERPQGGANFTEAQKQVLKNTLEAIRNNPPGKFEQRAKLIGANTDLKNQTYGDAFRKIADIIKIMYPDGVSVERMGDFTLLVRVLDKLCRISCGDKKAFEENPWRDVCGYSLLGMEDI